MKCPVCKSPELQALDLEAGLRFFHCPACRGNWVRGVEYWKWWEQHGPNLPERMDQDSGLTLAEPGIHIDCPECRFRMVKYLVGHGFSFTIDHCEGCKGVWFERLEQIFITRFGPDDYAEIERVRTWLATRQNKQDLLAFLTDKDPFDV